MLGCWLVARFGIRRQSAFPYWIPEPMYWVFRVSSDIVKQDKRWETIFLKNTTTDWKCWIATMVLQVYYKHYNKYHNFIGKQKQCLIRFHIVAQLKSLSFLILRKLMVLELGWPFEFCSPFMRYHPCFQLPFTEISQAYRRDYPRQLFSPGLRLVKSLIPRLMAFSATHSIPDHIGLCREKLWDPLTPSYELFIQAYPSFSMVHPTYNRMNSDD